MKTKYYSDITKKYYDTEEECIEAEAFVEAAEREKEEKLAKRAERAKEVQEKFEEAEKVRKEANELLEAFLKDYGSYHTTIKSPYMSVFDSIFDRLFDF